MAQFLKANMTHNFCVSNEKLAMGNEQLKNKAKQGWQINCNHREKTERKGRIYNKQRHNNEICRDSFKIKADVVI